MWITSGTRPLRNTATDPDLSVPVSARSTGPPCVAGEGGSVPERGAAAAAAAVSFRWRMSLRGPRQGRASAT